jgi:hypothetical protein
MIADVHFSATAIPEWIVYMWSKERSFQNKMNYYYECLVSIVSIYLMSLCTSGYVLLLQDKTE